MWREKIQALEPSSTFFPAATTQQIETVEGSLEHPIPNDLKALLAETNGVLTPAYSHLINNVNDLLKNNLFFRRDPTYAKIFMPFDCLLFFAEAGNGDMFAFRITGGDVRKEVFAWNHENDSRTWVAPSLETYLEWFYQGKISY